MGQGSSVSAPGFGGRAGVARRFFGVAAFAAVLGFARALRGTIWSSMSPQWSANCRQTGCDGGRAVMVRPSMCRAVLDGVTQARRAHKIPLGFGGVFPLLGLEGQHGVTNIAIERGD